MLAKRKGAATLADVARQAGVSVMSASAVLNQTSSGSRVGPATRQRILECAKELGYAPNRLAQSLRSRQSNILGYYSEYGNLEDPSLHFDEVVKGSMKGAAAAGKGLLFCPLDGDEESFARGIMNGLTDGLVVFARRDSPVIAKLKAEGFPMVAHTDELPGVPSVVVDDDLGGRLQARRLAELGRKCALYRSSHIPFVSAEARKSSFLDEAAKLGIEVIEGEKPSEHGEQKLADWERQLFLEGKLDSMVCFEDVLAHATLPLLESLGIEVPAKASVIGFNGIIPELSSERRITTIKAPFREAAETAAKLLVELIKGNPVPEKTVLPVTLMPGATG